MYDNLKICQFTKTFLHSIIPLKILIKCANLKKKSSFDAINISKIIINVPPCLVVLIIYDVLTLRDVT
jgi:hypothetical protein